MSILMDRAKMRRHEFQRDNLRKPTTFTMNRRTWHELVGMASLHEMLLIEFKTNGWHLLNILVSIDDEVKEMIIS